MHVSFALFADAANLSQEGKLNILGVFDAVQVASMPTVHPRATLVVRLKGGRSDVGTHTMALRWLNPQGNELWSSTGELNIADAPPGAADMDMPLIATLDLPIDVPGRYTMAVALDGEPTAEAAVQVNGVMQAPVMPARGMVS
jgi:uncharacterized protein DUF6941